MNCFQETFLRCAADHYGFDADFDFVLVTLDDLLIPDTSRSPMTSKLGDKTEDDGEEEKERISHYSQAIKFYREHIRNRKFQPKTKHKWSHYYPNGPNYCEKVTETMSQIFISSLIKNYLGHIDYEFAENVLLAFQGDKEQPIASVQSMVKHYVDCRIFTPSFYTLNDANIFQQRFLLCAVKHYEIEYNCYTEGSKYDSEHRFEYIKFLDYLVSTFNKLALNEEEEFTGQWIKFQYDLTILLRDNRIRKRNLSKCKKIYYPREVVTKMDKTFIDSFSTAMKIDYKFCCKVLDHFHGKQGLKSTEEDVKLTIKYLHENKKGEHPLAKANIFQRNFLALTSCYFRDKNDFDIINGLVDNDYIVNTFNGLKINDDQQFAPELIIEAYESTIGKLGAWFLLEQHSQETIEKMENIFIENTKKHFCQNIDIKFTANIITSFRDVQKSLYHLPSPPQSPINDTLDNEDSFFYLRDVENLSN